MLYLDIILLGSLGLGSLVPIGLLLTSLYLIPVEAIPTEPPIPEDLFENLVGAFGFSSEEKQLMTSLIEPFLKSPGQINSSANSIPKNPFGIGEALLSSLGNTFDPSEIDQMRQDLNGYLSTLFPKELQQKLE